MTQSRLLTSLLAYKATADSDLVDALTACAETADPAAFATALSILSHIHVVDRIFAAHLTGQPHGFTKSSQPVPPLADLGKAVRTTDAWYIDHVAGTAADRFDETVTFRFTDGQNGCLSRAEMLAHVVTHAGYHRGEIGRLLPAIGTTAERDVFAGHLHRADPSRRLHPVAMA